MYPSTFKKQKQSRQRDSERGFRRFLLVLVFLSLVTIVAWLLVIGQLWLNAREPGEQPTPSAVVILSPTPSHAPSPTTVPTLTPAPTAAMMKRIDLYINHLTQTQQIGQLLMLPVYADSYTSALDQPLQRWDIANAMLYNQYNGGPLRPSTLAGWTQLTRDLRAHANQPLILATDEEGGGVDRLAPYYGPTPSPWQLAATGDPQRAYAQAQLDAERLLAGGINTDFAPLADVFQGGAIDQSRMFGNTPAQVITHAGAFLDGLQQHGVMGTLKHWPGLGAAPANPDYALPTISRSQAQLQAIDFAPFRALLAHQPGLIMVTHAMVPAYDPRAPASLSPVLVDQVLRGQLGYQGIVITDAMSGGGLLQFMRQEGVSDPAQAIATASVRAILAGVDIVLCPMDSARLAAVVTAVTTAVQSGYISPERLRQSLRRIIALKARMGLISLP